METNPNETKAGSLRRAVIICLALQEKTIALLPHEGRMKKS